jgi:ClpX C4-type zinc finger
MVETVYCSFCARPSADVERVVAGPGVHICTDCVELCVQVLAAAKTADAVEGKDRPRVPAWESMSDEQVLEHLPRVAKVAVQVEDNLHAWVDVLRARDVTWARIGAALGMTRQSAWERFAAQP